MTTCPSHEDSTPSLSISPGTNQPVVLKCMGGCETEDILNAAGLEWADISEEKTGTDKFWTPGGRASDIYPYYLADGTLEYEVLRVPDVKGKRFFQRQPDPDAPHGYRWNIDGATRVLYRLPQVLAAVRAGATIHIAEGEKCVHALLDVIAEGDEATTNSGGAGRWTEAFSASIEGANVIIYADSNEVGREHARDVRKSLMQHACNVTIVEAPPGRMRNGQPIGDVADHLAAGHSLNALLETTPDSEAVKVRSGADWITDVIARPETQYEFIIPGVLARSERLLMVGIEGHGKSMWCRQIAACVASGVHPFRVEPMEPRRVLYIDAENHPGQCLGDWKTLHRITSHHGDPQPGMMTILEEWDSQIDLTNVKGQTWLKERVHAYRPDLLVLGPLKNLCRKNLTDHETVNDLRETINKVRSISGAAVIMEHHAPLRMGGDKQRELRPYGSGLFLGWPDFGYALQPTDKQGEYEWRMFRGDRVRGREWPEGFRWGRPGSMQFPWEPIEAMG